MKKRPVIAKDYLKLLNDCTSPAYIINAETFSFIEVNNAACEVYGYSPLEFKTLTALQLHPPESHPKLYVDRIILGNMKVYYGNWTHVKKDGVRLSVKITADKIVFQNTGAWFITAVQLP